MKHWKTSLMALAAAAVLPLASHAQQASGDFKERTIRVSHVVPKDHPFQVGVEKYAEILAQKSGGKLKMIGFPDGQLGAELQSILQRKVAFWKLHWYPRLRLHRW